MSSFATFVVLFLLSLLLLVLPTPRVAESNSVEPLPVRVITPKRISAIAPAIVEPLRAPVSSVSDIAVCAQQLSISDPTADVDDLISSFSSFSMKVPLPRSCRKSLPLPRTLQSSAEACTALRSAMCSLHSASRLQVPHRTTGSKAAVPSAPDSSHSMLTSVSPVKRDRRTPDHRRVHFETEIISEVHLIEISPDKLVHRGKTQHSIRPHIPGNKFFATHQSVRAKGRISCTSRTCHLCVKQDSHVLNNHFYQDDANFPTMQGQLYMLKHDGVFNSPGRCSLRFVSCGNIRKYNRCESCLVPRQPNMCAARDCEPVHSIHTPRIWPANLPYYT